MRKIKLFILLTLIGSVMISCDEDKDNSVTYSGNLDSTSKIEYQGINGGPCIWTVQYSNNVLEITLDESKTKVVEAKFTTNMSETINDCEDGDPARADDTHIYTLNNSSISGSDVSIDFNQDAASFPQNDATFIGMISDAQIQGKIKLKRTSNASFFDLTVEIDGAIDVE